MEGGKFYETYQDTEYQKPAEFSEKGRLRRVPDILPVRMQDQLHGRQSDLRAEEEMILPVFDHLKPRH